MLPIPNWLLAVGIGYWQHWQYSHCSTARRRKKRRGEDDRLAVVVERDPEQREVARRNVEGVAEDVVDAARVGGVPRAGDDIGEKNSISR